MRLGKYHGLGNDFLVALAVDNPTLAPDAGAARSLCDRHLGVGADGLLYGLDPGPGGHADARMVLLNADGGEAEISGNGVRCLAHALLRRGGRTDGSLHIETAAGVRSVRVLHGDVDRELWSEASMGTARPGPPAGPAAEALGAERLATVDLGNPHVVLLVDDPAVVDLAAAGSAVEADHPSGINVHFVRVEGPDRIEMRIWERGVGATEACGSGACAAVVAARGWGLVDGRVEVVMPGGTALVDLVDRDVRLTGPSVHVGEVVAG